MASKIDVVIQHALRTFSKRLTKLPDRLQSEINELKLLTDELTPNDITKLRGLMKNSELKAFLKKKKASLDYLSVFEDDSISVGVFMLADGEKLPIHDHPNMYGIIKVLEGILKITSYTVIDLDKSTVINDKSMFYNHPLKVVKYPEVIVTDKDRSCLLTPVEKNIHEVECIEGPAAFLDILSPPYDYGSSNHPRVCHFFEETGSETEAEDSGQTYLTLVQVPSPF